MKIVFLHVYSEKNTGDAAIVSVMLHKYRQQYPDAEIVLSSITPQKNKAFHDAPYISSFFQEAIYTSEVSSQRILKTVTIALGALCGGIFFTKPLKEFSRHLKEADLVVGTGGGYIIAKKTKQGWATLLLTLLEFWYAKKLGKTVILEAMSIGPLESNVQKKLTSKILNMLDVIHIRELISLRFLKSIEVNKPQIKKSVDLGFFFAPKTKTKMKNYLIKRGFFFTKPVLGITVKKCFDLEDPRQKAYEDAIAGFVNKVLQDRDMKVVFIPHVTAKAQNDDDRDIMQRIKPKLVFKEKCILLMEEYDYRDIKGIYENLNWLVGTRMHSVIFAYTADVPVVAIAYEPKTNGIMKTLGLEKQVINADSITAGKLYSTLSLL
jgi:colanic acid/amylovoran biosynthesis protein